MAEKGKPERYNNRSQDRTYTEKHIEQTVVVSFSFHFVVGVAYFVDVGSCISPQYTCAYAIDSSPEGCGDELDGSRGALHEKPC